MRKRRKGATALWLSSVQAGFDTWTTLTHRVPMLLSGMATEQEKQRMVVEKLEAGVASTLATGRTMHAILRRRPTTDPMIALGRAAELAQSSARPFQTRVASNAARLNRAARTRKPHG